MPIRTEVELVEDEGVPFLVRVVSNLERKARAVQPPPDGKPPKNPFLAPYEEDLFVSGVPPAHACLLNKFNVFDYHALLVTQAYEDQDSLLTPADFEALLTCMAEFDSLAFYNGGRLAGRASPTSTSSSSPCLWPPGVAAPRWMRPSPGARLPFRHALGPPLREPSQAHATYRELLRAVGREQPGTPYNLLATNEWTLVVPRTQETFESISLNALAFVGSLLVRNREQLERVRAVGPMAMLRAVTGTSGG